MKLFLFCFLLIYSTDSFPGPDSTDTEFDLYTVRLKDNLLQVISNEGTILYHQQFHNADYTTADMDSDGVEEYLVTDYALTDEKNDYSIFVFNTIDSFYCADTIKSGFFEPYVYLSDEAGSNVIVTGIPGLNKLNIGKDDAAMPINVWKYEDSKITLVNDQIYDLFESENETIIEYLDDYFDSNVETCNSSQQVNNVIAAGYINFKNAGELSVASQFLKKYYLCPDIDIFKASIENIARVIK